MSNYHIITSFSRPQNLQFYKDNLRNKDVIWHPITKNLDINFEESWIQPFSIGPTECVETETDINYCKLNKFIQRYTIIDEDRYSFLNDDDWVEGNVIPTIKSMNQPVIFCSMKRGNRVPSIENDPLQFPTSTLKTFPGVKVCQIGIQQCFVKGFVLKTMNFTEISIGDGLMAEWLQLKHDVIHLPEIYVLFNYLQKGRYV